MKKLTAYFSKGELALWGGSVALILVSFVLFILKYTACCATMGVSHFV